MSAAEGDTVETSQVLAHIEGKALVLTLNRQKALNALSLTMVRMLREALAFAHGHEAIELVILQAAAGRAFSAGGDIVTLCDWGRNEPQRWESFIREEYSLDLETSCSTKPVVSLWDGIVMGGGAGISMHTARRIATENLRFAMPEVGIGFYPDVGGTHLLPRLEGQIGRFLALTGERIGWHDSALCGLASACVPSDRLAALRADLASAGAHGLDEAIAGHAVAAEAGPLTRLRPLIDEAFAGDDLMETVARLEKLAVSHEEAARWLSILRSRSPISLHIANRQMKEGANLDLAGGLALEYRISEGIRTGHDFYEGVRAAVIDKDQTPRWSPDSLEGVSEREVDRYFAPVSREWSPEPLEPSAFIAPEA